MSIWRLPDEVRKLRELSPAQTIAAIWVRRMVIRNHRDQKGDDRCWLDDWFVWQLLDDTPPMPRYSPEDGMGRCVEFWQLRNASDVDTAPRGFIADPDHWDDDLWTKADRVLAQDLADIQRAIHEHRDGPIAERRPRTVDDDRALYDVLPEGIPADFRLPALDEFLGEALSPTAGCPSFWRSHGTCPSDRCNFHRWGPCV